MQLSSAVFFVALFCLTQILHEDIVEHHYLLCEFIRSGILRYVVESVLEINLTGCEARDIRSLEHCNIVLVCIVVYSKFSNMNFLVRMKQYFDVK
ncbi:unnamed protein product [Thelazia callipaeda]|uniref:Secreted protein n=1 Tax=Thelazia callipaeda TaxID=103827 RepID=A0A0N5CTF3_THECL|nr:unnamed protein product [Thelazia callipaeda]